LNSAGEGTFVTKAVWFGVAPTEPLNPKLISVTPN